MLVKNLIEGIEIKEVSENKIFEMEIDNLSFDTRGIKSDSAFILIKGSSFDPYEKVKEIYDSGKVKFFISEKRIENYPYLLVENCRKAFGLLCRNYFGIDFSRILLFGVTGTNGKTTTNYLVDSILKAAEFKTIRIGTTEYMIVDESIDANNTTPGIYEIFEMIKKGVEKGGCAVCMEVSSHALEQDRVFGLKFDVAIFTNLTGDHLDYHKSMENYYESKKKLFTEEYSRRAVINLEHDYGKRLYGETSIEKYSFALTDGDIYAKDIVFSLDGIKGKLVLKGKEVIFDSHLVGKHNLENILAAASAAFVAGIDIDSIQKGINNFQNVPGRLEKFEKDGAYFFVDYAHTDDALKNVLQALKPFKKNRLITVFGCGGDRDRTKRPRMARVAEEYSDMVVVTSDNPRTEDPKAIIDEILTGFTNKDRVKVEVDRRKAIKFVCEEAKAGDIVLIAGKGHENYQIIGKTKYHFDDREEVAGNLGVKFETF